jgi:hypothetical protein
VSLCSDLFSQVFVILVGSFRGRVRRQIKAYLIREPDVSSGLHDLSTARTSFRSLDPIAPRLRRVLRLELLDLILGTDQEVRVGPFDIGALYCNACPVLGNYQKLPSGGHKILHLPRPESINFGNVSDREVLPVSQVMIVSISTIGLASLFDVATAAFSISSFILLPPLRFRCSPCSTSVLASMFSRRAGRSRDHLDRRQTKCPLRVEITHGNHPRSMRVARVFQCLAVPRQLLKLLETLEIRVLKRLASAVQLRPWPPCSQSLSSAPNLNSVPFCSKKPNKRAESLPQQYHGTVVVCAQFSCRKL